MSGEELLHNQGNFGDRPRQMEEGDIKTPELSWAAAIEAKRASPEITWRAVRRAIWEARNTSDSAGSQSVVRSFFERLEDTSLTNTLEKLAEEGARFSNSSNASVMATGQGYLLALEAIKTEMGVSQSASRT